jgi:hypothetical protein
MKKAAEANGVSSGGSMKALKTEISKRKYRENK